MKKAPRMGGLAEHDLMNCCLSLVLHLGTITSVIGPAVIENRAVCQILWICFFDNPDHIADKI